MGRCRPGGARYGTDSGPFMVVSGRIIVTMAVVEISAGSPRPSSPARSTHDDFRPRPEQVQPRLERRGRVRVQIGEGPQRPRRRSDLVVEGRTEVDDRL